MLRKNNNLFVRPWEILFLFFLMIGALFIRVPNLGTAGIHVDELYSITAARSISKTGKPLFPSGSYYYRSPVYHYSSAFISSQLGDNILSHRALSLFFSIAILPLVYFFGRYFFEAPIAVATCIFLVFSSFENTYSYFARMYMLFQFFALLLFWFFYKAFFEHKKIFLAWLALLYPIALYVHQASFFILLILFSSIIFAWSLRQVLKLPSPSISKLTTNLKPKVLFGVFFTFISLFFFFYRFPNTLQPTTINFFQYGFKIFTPNFSILFPEQFFPLTTLLVVISAIYIFWKRDSFNYFYILYTTITTLIAIALFTTFQNRFLLFLFPLIVLLSFYGIEALFRASRWYWNRINKKTGVLLVVLSLLIVFTHTALALTRTNPAVYSFNSYLYDHRSYYDFVKSLSRSDDIVICTDPARAYFFFRCDYFLRSKYVNDSLQEFPEETREPYWGIPVIGSYEAIRSLTKSSRVWVIMTHRAYGNVNPGLLTYIDFTMRLVHTENEGLVRIYVND